MAEGLKKPWIRCRRDPPWLATILGVVNINSEKSTNAFNGPDNSSPLKALEDFAAVSRCQFLADSCASKEQHIRWESTLDESIHSHKD